MDICSIYVITNLVNGKVYVGQTWNSLSRRFREHCVKAGPKLANAIAKYGKDSFSVSILAAANTQEDADTLEQFWIAIYNSTDEGYNIREGGLGGKHPPGTNAGDKNPMYGKKLSEEHKKKLSENNPKFWLGKKLSEETKKKQSISHGRGPDNPLYGITRSPEVRRRMSEGRTGKKRKPFSSEWIENLSQANAGENNAAAKINWAIVAAIRSDYKGGSFTQKELALKYGLSQPQISAIIRNKSWAVDN